VMPVTSPRQRAVLAVLLLHANRSVSAAELLDQVWGEGHPATASGLVHTYIWQLRRLLAPHEPAGGRPRITSEPGGYLLRVAEGELDAHVFEQLAMAGLAVFGVRSGCGPGSLLLTWTWPVPPPRSVADWPSCTAKPPARGSRPAWRLASTPRRPPSCGR